MVVTMDNKLAVALIIAFNGLIMNKRKDEIVTTKPHIDEDEVVDEKITLEAKDIVAEVSRLRLSENDLKKFDKDLKYIKKWVPDVEKSTYMEPIIDHKEARERCLRVYKEAVG